MDEEKKNIIPPRKKNYFKVILKVIFYIIFVILILNAVLYLLLSIPAIQQKAVNFLIEKQLKPKIKTEVRVDKVRIRLFNNINLQGIYIEDQKKDTLLYAKELEASFNIWKIFNSELVITGINLDSALIKINQENTGSSFNFQFLIDAFASDTTQQDTTSSSLKMSINDVNIKDARIHYDVFSEFETPGTFNPYHILLTNFNTNIDLPSIETTELDITIHSLSLVEKSGFIINNLETRLQSRGVTFWTDRLNLKLPDSYLTADSVRYNIFTDSFSFIGEMNISPEDAAPLLPELKELTGSIYLKTNARGRFPAINAEGITFNYGEDLILQANASIEDFNNYSGSSVRLVIDNFRVTPKAITQFSQITGSDFTLPEILDVVEYFRLKGTLAGTLNNLNLDAEAWTNQGSIQVDSHISIADTTFENYSIEAVLQTRNFNLAPFAGAETGIGRISLNTNLSANSINGSLRATANGVVEALQFDTLNLRNIQFRANYTPERIDATVNADLPIGQIMADASMIQTTIPEYLFDINIRNLAVDYFYNNPAWINPKLNLSLTGDITGTSIDNFQGEGRIDSLRIWGDNFNYNPGIINVELGTNNDNNQYISLHSFIVDAYLVGKYQFTTLADEVLALINNSLPSLLGNNAPVATNSNNFTVDMFIHNMEDLANIFDLPATAVETVNMHATINTIDNDLRLVASAPHIQYGETDIMNTIVQLHNHNTHIDLQVDTEIPIDTGRYILNLNSEILSDTVHASFKFRNERGIMDINGGIEAAAHFELTSQDQLYSYINFAQTPIQVGNLNLLFMPASVTNINDRTTVSNFGLQLEKEGIFRQYIGAEGIISDQPQDTLSIHFYDAEIGDILQAFDIQNIHAVLDGNIRLTNLMDSPEFYTDNLRAEEIIIFNDTLGTLYVESNWNNNLGTIDLDARLVNPPTTSRISGQIFTEEERLNLEVDLDRLSVHWIQPFLGDMLNRMDGSISSQITLIGSMEAPVTRGWMGFNDMYVGVDYTNVTYHISDTIKLRNDSIGFRDLVIRDSNMNTGNLSALIKHNNFSNIEFLARLDLDNLMVLNTAERTDSLFYGKVMASGNIKMTGNLEDINIRMDIQNERNSFINITIPEISEATDYESIVYINVPVQDSTLITETIPEDPLPLKITSEINVTPDITLGVIMNSDNPIDMQMKGSGQIRFDYDMVADNMRLYGDYILSDGTVRIRPQNIRTIEFRIEDGSKVNLLGDPMRSTFDITAYYRVNARLSTLDENLSGTRIPVNCILGIKGNLDKIELTYDIKLPEASEDVQQEVNSIINTEEQKIRNFAYLILFGSFYSSTGGLGNTNVLSTIASNTLSSGLDAVFGSVLGDNWQIGTNIDVGDGSYSDVTVNLSTRLLNDKLTFNTNLGYRTDNTSASTDETFVGDFDVEYQLTNTLSLKAYNHTNDRFYKTAPTTQGIGIVYTKEAKTFKRLFRSFRRRRNTNTEQTNSTNNQPEIQTDNQNINP